LCASSKNRALLRARVLGKDRGHFTRIGRAGQYKRKARGLEHPLGMEENND